MDKKEMEDKIKAMEEELSKLKEELNKEEKGYFKPREHEEYYCIDDTSGIIKEYEWCDMNCDNICYENANCFETKEEAEKVAFEQTLFRKIRRFRDTYDKWVVDWNDNNFKYYIRYKYDENILSVDFIKTYKDFGNIYFTSKEVAERCLKEFKEDIEKYFTGNY